MPQQHYSIEQALMKLGEITALLEKQESQHQPATDHAIDRMLANIDGSPEAVEFCIAANALGRRLRGVADCRPSLRERAEDSRRDSVDLAVEFAENARQFHRR